MNRTKKILLALLFLVGLLMTSYPFLTSYFFDLQARREIESLQAAAGQTEKAAQAEDPRANMAQSEPEDQADPGPLYPELYQAMLDYNAELASGDQSASIVAGSYETPALALADYGLESDIIGYISVPAMEVELPLYLGSTKSNMSRGAVLLGRTSLPTGGVDTNCVIAAHRGYRGIPYFRQIELLQVGDRVEITTLWETLSYQVTGWEVVSADSLEEILIQPGKDMVTLLTCHPYRVGTKRYLVYCERLQEAESAAEVQVPDLQEPTPEALTASVETEQALPTASEESVEDTSQLEIDLEQQLQLLGLLLVLMAGVLIGGLLLLESIQTQKWPGKGRREANRKNKGGAQ